MCSLCRKALRDPKVVSFPDSQPKPQPVLKQHSALIDVLMIALIALLGLLAVNYLDGQVSPEVAPRHGVAGDPQTSRVISALHETPSRNTSEQRAYWIFTGIDYAATFADAAVSSRSHFAPGLGSCHEGNPLLGSPYPSTRRLWLSMTGSTTAVAGVAWLLKRGHHDSFVLLPLADALVHGTFAGTTAARCLP